MEVKRLPLDENSQSSYGYKWGERNARKKKAGGETGKLRVKEKVVPLWRRLIREDKKKMKTKKISK